MEDGKKENKKNKIIRNDIGYKKSNILISSKYKADLLENKILTYALAHVQKDGHYDENGQIIYSFSASEIRNILGIRSGSFYEKLKVTAEEMLGRMIALENAESHKFDYINI